jgi:hypothetical protein
MANTNEIDNQDPLDLASVAMFTGMKVSRLFVRSTATTMIRCRRRLSVRRKVGAPTTIFDVPAFFFFMMTR